MPQLVEHIDAIARKKERGVLFITFGSNVACQAGEADGAALFPASMDWENLPIRLQIIRWLEENHISWQPCGGIANPPASE